MMNLELVEKRKKIVEYCLKNNILVTKTVLDNFEKPCFSRQENSKDFLCFENPQAEQSKFNIKILSHYEKHSKKRTVQDFVSYLNCRYKAIYNILQNRQELQNLTSIIRFSNKLDQESVSIIGIVNDKQFTKNDNIIFELEDRTGFVKVIVNKNNSCYAVAKDIMLDEVIGVNGMINKEVIFANSIVLPDLPLSAEIKKSGDECYAVVISDIEVGAKLFLHKEFQSFIDWISGKSGTEEQRDIAGKVGYLFVVGDLVSGVGIYPGQKDELVIDDIYAQYAEFARYISQIPRHIKIIICPGNHDAVRLSEPQPRIPESLAPDLYKLPNVFMLSNPCVVNVHSSDVFPGFDFLLYHGMSYSYYSDVVPSIRDSGKEISDRTDMVMKFLLQRRHLAPTHKSSLYIPDVEEDALVISKVPDFFLSGHIHKSLINNYRGVVTICGSCWSPQSSFQEKMGHKPDPCKVPVINFKDRSIKILDFKNG